MQTQPHNSEPLQQKARNLFEINTDDWGRIGGVRGEDVRAEVVDLVFDKLARLSTRKLKNIISTMEAETYDPKIMETLYELECWGVNKICKMIYGKGEEDVCLPSGCNFLIHLKRES